MNSFQDDLKVHKALFMRGASCAFFKLPASISRAILLLSLSAAFAYCGGSPVREDFQKIQRIHLLGVAVVGPSYVTEAWQPPAAPGDFGGSRSLTQMQDMATGGTGGDTGFVDGELHIDSENYGAVGNFPVSGTCKDCDRAARYRISFAAARAAAGTALQDRLYANASAPFVDAANSRKLNGFRSAQELLENALGPRVDLPDPLAALKKYESTIQSPAFREFIAAHPEDAFVYVMVFLSPRLIPQTISTQGSEPVRDPATGQLTDKYIMKIDVNVGWDSLALNARTRPDMRYGNKPDTNLLNPGNQGCLPTIFTIRDFSSEPAKFGGSSAKFISVNWFDIARKDARRNVFRIQGSVRGGDATTDRNLRASLQNVMGPLGDELVIRLNDYIAAVRN